MNEEAKSKCLQFLNLDIEASTPEMIERAISIAPTFVLDDIANTITGETKFNKDQRKGIERLAALLNVSAPSHAAKPKPKLSTQKESTMSKSHIQVIVKENPFPRSKVRGKLFELASSNKTVEGYLKAAAAAKLSGAAMPTLRLMEAKKVAKLTS